MFEDKTAQELIVLKKHLELQISILDIRIQHLQRQIEKEKEKEDDEWWKKSKQKD